MMSRTEVQWPRRDAPGLNSVPLPERGSVLIGRRRDATIRIEGDLAVSREHAELRCLEGAWLIEDLDSTGGTYLMSKGAREKLIGRRRLRDGDRIAVGGTVLTFRCSPARIDEEATSLAEPETIDLTARERVVLDALCGPELAGVRGWPDNDTLASQLFISVETVRSHLRSLYSKFGLDDVPHSQRRARLVQRAVAEGWVGNARRT